MKNVLFVVHCYPGFGGVESITTNLLDYLGDDYNLYVLSFIQFPDAVASTKIKKLFCPPYWGVRPEVVAAEYNRIVAENAITHVVIQGMYPYENNMVFNPERDKSVKVIEVLHGQPGYEFYEADEYLEKYRKLDNRKWRRFRRLGIAPLIIRVKKWQYLGKFRKSYRKAAALSGKIVLLADAYIPEMIKAYGLSRYAEKIVAIPNSLAASWSSVPLPDFADKKNEIIFVGRLAKEKRVSKVIEVWSGLKNREGWKLTIVGDGPLRADLEKQCSDAGLTDVEFAGSTKNPAEYYRRSKILLLTSEYEGFGMVLIEAQRYGTVPVAFRASAGVQTVLENGGGVLVSQDDVIGLTAAVDGLMEDELELRRLSRSAYAKSDNWTIGKVGIQWKKLIDSL